MGHRKGSASAVYSRRKKEAVVDFPLGSLGLQIKAHWRKYRPQMSAQLQREGKLDEAVYAVQELTGETLYRLTVEGEAPARPGMGVGEGGVGVPPERGGPAVPPVRPGGAEQLSPT